MQLILQDAHELESEPGKAAATAPCAVATMRRAFRAQQLARRAAAAEALRRGLPQLPNAAACGDVTTTTTSASHSGVATQVRPAAEDAVNLYSTRQILN